MTINIFAGLFEVFQTDRYWLCKAGLISDPLFVVSYCTLGTAAIKDTQVPFFKTLFPNKQCYWASKWIVERTSKHKAAFNYN